jgi:hypothetical protein
MNMRLSTAGYLRFVFDAKTVFRQVPGLDERRPNPAEGLE